MDDWQKIVLGAGIAVLAGPLTEAFRFFFTDRHERAKWKRDFQHKTLGSLLEYMTYARVNAILALLDIRKLGFPATFQLETVVAFEESAVEANRYLVMAASDDLRIFSTK